MRARRSGFTLIEVLAVVAILALVVGVAGVAGSKAKRGDRAVSNAVDVDRRARMRARIEGEATLEVNGQPVRIDARGRSPDVRYAVPRDEKVIAWTVLGVTGQVVEDSP